MAVVHVARGNGAYAYSEVMRSSLKTSLARRRRLSVKAQKSPSRTQRIMERIATINEAGGAGGAYSYESLKRLDQLWSNICTAPMCKEVVSSFPGRSVPSDSIRDDVPQLDVVVCGGTLGIFIATALQSRGLRVAIVERSVLRGREQEWNISMKELLELADEGILSQTDIDQVISVKFNPNRCGFEGRVDVVVEDILNLGVSPSKLVEIMMSRFVSIGGIIYQNSSVSGICVYDDGAIVKLGEGEALSTRLVLDAMGNFSPIVKQIRKGKKPDGMCLVVGSCARGFDRNSSSDVIFSSSSVKKFESTDVHYFWEAFPAGSGQNDRTSYMFTYLTPLPSSPKLEELLEDYWNLMPPYQNVNLEDLEILRVVYGIFPTYRESPLPAAFDRVLQFGDASGIQSPVSFGGFGSLTRHLSRLSNGIHEAVAGGFLDARSLSQLNPYLPNLSASWLFQRAMSARRESAVSEAFINELLAANFGAMERLGDPVLRPFLQDVIQFGPLVKTLGIVMLAKPQLIPSTLKQVGVGVLLDWCGHFFMLGLYTLLSLYVDPVIRSNLDALPMRGRYQWKRRLEAWKYGAGLDYKL